MYKKYGDYAFDLEEDCYVNKDGQKMEVSFEGIKWFATFEDGVIIEAIGECELMEKVETFCKKSRGEG